MQNKFIWFSVFYTFLNIINAQERNIGLSVSSGAAFHKIYLVYDEGSNIDIDYFNSINLRKTVGFSYYFPFARIDANFSLYDPMEIWFSWKTNRESYGASIKGEESVNFSFNGILYRQIIYKNKHRLSLNPGFGFGVLKMNFLNENKPLSMIFQTSPEGPLPTTVTDSYLNKIGYHIIAALEGSLRFTKRMYLFVDLKYQLGIWQMYQRDINYFLIPSQTIPHQAQMRYNGTNLHIIGVRRMFGELRGFNVIQ